MNTAQEAQILSAQLSTRRQFLKQCSTGLGGIVMASFLGCNPLSAKPSEEVISETILRGLTHFAPTAKRVIFLHMAGGPSQLDLFDYKPRLAKGAGGNLPYKLPEIEATVGLDNTKLLGPVSKFSHHGDCGHHQGRHER